MKLLQVAAGVIKNPQGQILIALRDASLHQGGLWEFPGGKLEPGETAEQALFRELKEELDITAHAATPLITIRHSYPDRHVQLNVFLVESFSGLAKGCQGQPLKWVAPNELLNFSFPAANQPIVTAARLPRCYGILDDTEPALLMGNLHKLLDNGIKLIQARLKNLSADAVAAFIEQAYSICRQQQTVLLINSATANVANLNADGIHLTAAHLMALAERPTNVLWLSASCHTFEELEHAEQIGVDFVVLAPVLPTATHPGSPTLGWERFTELVSQVNLPVYALGGMTPNEATTACHAGGQGIAGISAFLE
ncbi:MAG: Nudix family hydrolase [Methylococcaceae bacterium]|nr:Nudix family hydrolase [Methylococcaceae bacterium]